MDPIRYQLDELPKVAAQIIEKAASKTVLFVGEMGAGKTTLIKEIVRQLGSVDRVSSPTFSLVNEYGTPNGLVFHFDFHRIENESEAYEIGFEEYLFSGAWVLIEWPEKISSLLPKNAAIVKIETLQNNFRKLKLC